MDLSDIEQINARNEKHEDVITNAEIEEHRPVSVV